MAKRRRQVRPLGEVTQDLEPLLQEMAYAHQMQAHEIIAMIFRYLQSHTDALETYTADGSKAVLYIGHWSGLK